MEVDLRSSDMKELARLNDKFKSAVDEAVAGENKRWNNHGPVSVSIELLGVRPAGQTAASSPIVKIALEVNQVLALGALLSEGSTDSNVPINQSVPAITIGGGGTGNGAHSLNEIFDALDSWKGTQRALLLAIALAQ